VLEQVGWTKDRDCLTSFYRRRLSHLGGQSLLRSSAVHQSAADLHFSLLASLAEARPNTKHTHFAHWSTVFVERKAKVLEHNPLPPAEQINP
jgi:hypothetical protein